MDIPWEVGGRQEEVYWRVSMGQVMAPVLELVLGMEKLVLSTGEPQYALVPLNNQTRTIIEKVQHKDLQGYEFLPFTFQL